MWLSHEKRSIVSTIVLFLFIVFTMFSCSLFRTNNQPLVSDEAHSLPMFDKTTSFPYLANDERRSSILNSYLKLQVGMNGDDVLKTLGRPDERSILAFVGDPPRGWIWDYNLYKKFERAPDESDRYIKVYFDVNGKVSEIKVRVE